MLGKDWYHCDYHSFGFGIGLSICTANLFAQDGLFGGIFFLVIFLFCNVFAYQQKEVLLNRTGAIVVAPTVNVKNTPAKSSSDQFVIHEGTRVDITDKSMDDWRGVRLADGRTGWVETKQIEEI